MSCIRSVTESSLYDPAFQTTLVVGTFAGAFAIGFLLYTLPHYLDKALSCTPKITPRMVTDLLEMAKWCGIGSAGCLGIASILGIVKHKFGRSYCLGPVC